MQHIFATLALTLFALLLPLPTLTAAKHAECYWTGPGKGTPEDQGFSKFGVAKQFKYTAYPDKPTPIRHEVVQYICFDYDDQPVVADWNNLRNQTLEMATPCGDNGYSGDCTYGLWGFRYEGFTDPKTGEVDPVRYLRKTDDCEWIGELTVDQLPKTMTIYHK